MPPMTVSRAVLASLWIVALAACGPPPEPPDPDAGLDAAADADAGTDAGSDAGDANADGGCPGGAVAGCSCDMPGLTSCDFGRGEGIQCCAGRWQEFVDGPCWPRPDAGMPAPCDGTPIRGCPCATTEPGCRTSANWRLLCESGVWVEDVGRVCC
jgi:hypothetical protein